MPAREVDLTFMGKKKKGKSFHTMTPEERQQYNAKYREENSYTITCSCGATLKAISFYNHKKTKQHTDYVSSSSQIA
jgi:hypothetical protein